MLDRLAAEAASAARRGSSFSIAVVDVDDFKKINDTFGHDVGDTVIVAIARALTEGLRAYDVSARWGGEEFLLMLPNTPGEGALIITERLRKIVEELEPSPELPAVRTTISIGVAEHCGDAIDETIKRADQVLYQAKRGGRNRVMLADAS
jgi:diguanylate cyclase (GGDEF)-like protein